MKEIKKEIRTENLINQLLEVWEDSVRVTHTFLSNKEIEKIKEYVPEALRSISHLVVLYADGECKEYYQNRIKDIKSILKNNESALKGAIIADKVIGKVASSILTVAGVKEIYADVMSKYAIPVLEKNNIKYEYKKIVDYVQNNDKTGMCPMENKYKDEDNINKIYDEMIH